MSVNLLGMELIKLRRRSGTNIVFAVYIAFLVLFLAGMVYASQTGRTTITLPRAWNDIYDMLLQITFMFGVITTVNITAAEYPWRTTRQNVIDGLSREQWFSAKAIMVLVVALMFWAAGWGLMIPVIGAIAETRDHFMTGGQVRAIFALLLACIGVGSFGLLASIATRHTAGALGVVAGWMTAGEGLVQLLLYRIDPDIMKYVAYLPGRVLTSLPEPARWTAEFMSQRQIQNLQAPLLSNLDVTLMAGFYTVLFLLTSFLVMRRQDL